MFRLLFNLFCIHAEKSDFNTDNLLGLIDNTGAQKELPALKHLKDLFCNSNDPVWLIPVGLSYYHIFTLDTRGTGKNWFELELRF